MSQGEWRSLMEPKDGLRQTKVEPEGRGSLAESVDCQPTAESKELGATVELLHQWAEADSEAGVGDRGSSSNEADGDWRWSEGEQRACQTTAGEEAGAGGRVGLSGQHSGTKALPGLNLGTEALLGLHSGTGAHSRLNSGTESLSGLDRETGALFGLDVGSCTNPCRPLALSGPNSGTGSLSGLDIETESLLGQDSGPEAFPGPDAGTTALSRLVVGTGTFSGLNVETGVTKGSDEGGRRGSRSEYKSISSLSEFHSFRSISSSPSASGAVGRAPLRDLAVHRFFPHGGRCSRLSHLGLAVTLSSVALCCDGLAVATGLGSLLSGQDTLQTQDNRLPSAQSSGVWEVDRAVVIGHDPEQQV
ncbi:Protein LIAT1 [Labeo rohita]|uniref:Protein LIAT1 n=1 Tax=Labeo rohita TaxID=84645 RepID=A0ABQ8MWU5_LABRO|nr:Protein LIAT1 [Labeo rohita]